MNTAQLRSSSFKCLPSWKSGAYSTTSSWLCTSTTSTKGRVISFPSTCIIIDVKSLPKKKIAGEYSAELLCPLVLPNVLHVSPTSASFVNETTKAFSRAFSALRCSSSSLTVERVEGVEVPSCSSFEAPDVPGDFNKPSRNALPACITLLRLVNSCGLMPSSIAAEKSICSGLPLATSHWQHWNHGNIGEKDAPTLAHTSVWLPTVDT